MINNYAIGGLFLRIYDNVSCVNHKKKIITYKDFLCSLDCSLGSIRVFVKRKTGDFDPDGREIFFGNHFELLQTSGGIFFYIRYWNKKQRIPYAEIEIDSCFSNFNCCIYSVQDHGNIKFDPFRTAADTFLLQHTFINHQGLIIHAAGGSVHSKGMIFSGPSGAGKSTLSLLLEQSPNNRLFSDERVIARSMEDGWRVWGTPWHGTGNIARNESAPLSALVFLTQAKETKITPLSPSAGLRRLLQVVSIPWYSKEWTNKGLAVCESLIQAVPMFELAFRPDQTAAEAVERLAASLP